MVPNQGSLFSLSKINMYLPCRPIPTTPGSCGVDCRLAATVKIVEGAEWTNSLLDPNTFEWQDLADKIKREVRTINA